MNKADDSGLITGPDGAARCWWQGNDPLYQAYHDHEWGRPSADDRYLFEKICLEGFQAGLSWITILRKRDHFRRVFANFEIERLARFDEADVERLLSDPGIIRHRGKINSAINNARRAIELVEQEGSLAAFIWQFEPGADDRPKRFDAATLRPITQSDQSVALARALKRRGWTFFGPTTAYAFMQAVGLVNDHLQECVCRQRCLEERTAFVPPRSDR